MGYSESSMEHNSDNKERLKKLIELYLQGEFSVDSIMYQFQDRKIEDIVKENEDNFRDIDKERFEKLKEVIFHSKSDMDINIEEGY